MNGSGVLTAWLLWPEWRKYMAISNLTRSIEEQREYWRQLRSERHVNYSGNPYLPIEPAVQEVIRSGASESAVPILIEYLSDSGHKRHESSEALEYGECKANDQA